MTSPPIGVLGGGSFGKALCHAVSAASQNVLLCSRRAAPSIPASCEVSADFADLAKARLIFVAVPSQKVEALAREVGRHLDGRHMLVHVSRGLVGPELRTVAQVLRDVTPCRRVGALAGPLVADSMVRGEPGGGIVGSAFQEVCDAVRAALPHDRLRIYDTQDLVGVELSSAMVGLLSLAIGFARGLGLGPGALGTFVTRGMAEAIHVASFQGAKRETFTGLAGLGDLLAAVAGDERPELQLGEMLATIPGSQLEPRAAGGHIEAIDMAQRVAHYGRRLGIDTPVTLAISKVLSGEMKAADAMHELMARNVGKE